MVVYSDVYGISPQDCRNWLKTQKRPNFEFKSISTKECVWFDDLSLPFGLDTEKVICAFKESDWNKDGVLGMEEFQSAIAKLGFDFPLQVVDELFQMCLPRGTANYVDHLDFCDKLMEDDVQNIFVIFQFHDI